MRRREAVEGGSCKKKERETKVSSLHSSSCSTVSSNSFLSSFERTTSAMALKKFCVLALVAMCAVSFASAQGKIEWRERREDEEREGNCERAVELSSTSTFLPSPGSPCATQHAQFHCSEHCGGKWDCDHMQTRRSSRTGTRENDVHPAKRFA